MAAVKIMSNGTQRT